MILPPPVWFLVLVSWYGVSRRQAREVPLTHSGTVGAAIQPGRLSCRFTPATGRHGECPIAADIPAIPSPTTSALFSMALPSPIT
jgi:hypothetical protein